MSLLLAESGSTKTDWVLLKKGSVIATAHTAGVNPYHQTPDQILQSIQDVTASIPDTTHVVFYGAGCGPQTNRQVVSSVLAGLYPDAIIEVEHDLLAACRSVSANEQHIVAILGTGSNTCHFDGNDVIENKTALGYVMGDEGGGAHLGKLLLQGFLHKKISGSLDLKFQEAFGNDTSVFLKKIYQEPNPNRYLASFAPFIHQNLDDESARDLVLMTFNQLFNLYISFYPSFRELGVCAVGSIAHHFESLLNEVAQHHETELVRVLQRPMDGLISYHSIY